LPPILLDFEVIGPIARTIGDLIAVTKVLSGTGSRRYSLPVSAGLRSSG